MNSTNNMGEYFDNLFSVIVANTPQLKQEVYKIRYQVYCEELQYEAKENFPEKMEQDKFDSRSIHFLLKHKASNSYVGCVRLILADPKQPLEPFPFETKCQHNIDFNQQPRKNFCEVSRLAVRGEFRRRKGEENTAQGLLFFNDKPPQGIEERRVASVIPMSLYYASICSSLRLGLNILLLSEATLSRHLRMCDIPNYQIGDFVEYRGKRRPFLIRPEEVTQKLRSDNRQIFETIDSNISRSLPYQTRNLTKRQVSASQTSNFFTASYGLA